MTVYGWDTLGLLGLGMLCYFSATWWTNQKVDFGLRANLQIMCQANIKREVILKILGVRSIGSQSP